ncbi:MAG: long-chain-fatty-acid--CoA ligase [Brevibacillus sp.]|nr:long-chain-fatty-acid--CoA ligase [Brevibacillus sp.]
MDVGYLTRRSMGSLPTIDPDRCALKLENEEAWTYGELHRISNAYANALRQLGVKKGDRVGILLFNCMEYWALYFAVAKIGGIAVRLNFRLSSQEFAYALADSGTSVLCFHASLSERLTPIVSDIPVQTYISLQDGETLQPSWAKSWDVLTSGDPGEVTDVRIDADDPVMLMYTSGTTGRPKGALWSHANTLWFCNMQVVKWQLDSRSVCMTTGPLYHVGGMEDLALPVMLAGGTVVITKSGGFNIERVVHVMETQQVTDCLLFPFMVYDLLNSQKLSRAALSSVRRIFSGGDPIIPWAIEQLNDRFPHIGIVQVYGLTEGTPIAVSLDPQDARAKSHTVGKPMPFAEIKVVDEQGERVGVGEAGEICIKSPAVARGYWQKPDATAVTFVDGWCHTGDLGTIDSDGFLAIAGRKKDMIRSGGENIYPVEIEDTLIRHPSVVDVAVIGIPDPQYVETVCAVVVPRPGAQVTVEEIIQYATEHLASYKKPRKVVFVSEIPRTPSGKIQKYVLRDRYRTS